MSGRNGDRDPIRRGTLIALFVLLGRAVIRRARASRAHVDEPSRTDATTDTAVAEREAAAAAAAQQTGPRDARTTRSWTRLLCRPRLCACLVILLMLAIGGGAVTAALLSDRATASTVSTTGGQLNAPATGPTYTRLASALRVAWTPPSTGLVPQTYEVWRRDPAGSYPASALGSSATSPYDDTTVVECNEYYYRLRSTYENMRSVYTSEQHVLYDTIPPNVTASAIVATSGPSPTANWVKPLGEYYVYVTVNDNCLSDQSGVTMTADLRNLGELSSTASMTFGSYTPVSGGATYNFRAGPFTAVNLLDGSQPSWTVTATDPVANAKTFTGATVTVDGTAPASARTPQITADLTNYYAPELGYGEIRRNDGYRVYAEFNDGGSGLSSGSVTSNTSNVTLSGAAATPLAGGTYSTDNGIVSWNFRTASMTTCNGPSPCPSDGAVVGFSVTATDAVGNATTVGDQTATSAAKVEIDTTALELSSCGGGTNVTADDRLNGSTDGTSYDRNVLGFNDTVDPAGLAPGWTGSSALTGAMELANGDLFVVTTDFLWFDYLTLTAAGSAEGTGADQNFELGSTAWIGVSGDVVYSSDFTRDTRSQFTLRYWNQPTGIARPALAVAGTVNLNPNLSDAAGNKLPSTLLGISCSVTAW